MALATTKVIQVPHLRKQTSMLLHPHLKPSSSFARRRLVAAFVGTQRALQIRQRSYHELSYAQNGEPRDVLRFRSDPYSADARSFSDRDRRANDTVVVDMKYAPLNPADINTIQGRYPLPHASLGKDTTATSSLDPGHRVAGSEGIGRVVETSSPDDYPLDTLVAICYPGQGTFRSTLSVPKDRLICIPRGEELLQRHGAGAGCLYQLGGTALRMLTDFVPIQAGDIIVQNGGTSGVGVMVSQLASSLFGAQVISIVRRGERNAQQFKSLQAYLCTHAKAAIVVAEEDLTDREGIHKLREQMSQLSSSTSPSTNVPLALNCIGGPSAKNLLRLLDPHGTMVTYGGMSMQPVSVATSQFIFQDQRLRGYWHGRWLLQNSLDQRQTMVDEITNAVLDSGVQCPPHECVPLAEFEQALRRMDSNGHDEDGSGGDSGDGNGVDANIRRKIIFDCQEQLDRS